MKMVKKIMVSSLGLLLGNLFKQYDDMGNTYILMMSLKKKIQDEDWPILGLGRWSAPFSIFCGYCSQEKGRLEGARIVCLPSSTLGRFNNKGFSSLPQYGQFQ